MALPFTLKKSILRRRQIEEELGKLKHFTIAKIKPNLPPHPKKKKTSSKRIQNTSRYYYYYYYYYYNSVITN
jgi:hypothetical protein